MNKRPRPTDGGGNWMDTYGDLVTLLLTFFVLLFAMSSLNEQKWEVFVRSINPNGGVVAEDQVAVNGTVESNEDELTGSIDIPEEQLNIDVDKLYLTLAERMNEIGIDGVTISRGEDYTFIMFEDKTFFDGDSSILTDLGKKTLDVFVDAIEPAESGLSQINIMAHTAQGDPDRPNNIRTDRMLSAMRAAEVCIFIQEKGVIQPQKLVNISYGQFRPVAENATREGRAKNRRVEILMLDEGADLNSMNKYYEEYNRGVNADTTVVTGGQTPETEPAFESVESNADGVAATMSPLNSRGNESGFSSDITAGDTKETVAE